MDRVVTGFRPIAKQGRLAGWLGIAFLGWFVLNQVYVGLYGRRTTDPSEPIRAVLIGFGVAGLALGLAASIVAMMAICKGGERSIAVYLCLMPALFVVVFVMGELFFPH